MDHQVEKGGLWFVCLFQPLQKVEDSGSHQKRYDGNDALFWIVRFVPIALPLL